MWESSITDAPHVNSHCGGMQYRCAGTATRARSRSDPIVSSHPEWKYDFNVRPIINSIVLALIVTGRHYLAHVKTSLPRELGFTNTTIALHADRGFTNYRKWLAL